MEKIELTVTVHESKTSNHENIVKIHLFRAISGPCDTAVVVEDPEQY